MDTSIWFLGFTRLLSFFGFMFWLGPEPGASLEEANPWRSQDPLKGICSKILVNFGVICPGVDLPR